ncbi:MAG: glutaredoxin domain-containing protein [Dehalococcoidia bacterium]
MDKLIIYTLHGCETSKRALRDLIADGVDFEERCLDDDPKWIEEASRLAISAPIIVRGDRIEVGWKGDTGCAFM